MTTHNEPPPDGGGYPTTDDNAAAGGLLGCQACGAPRWSYLTARGQVCRDCWGRDAGAVDPASAAVYDAAVAPDAPPHRRG